MRDITSAWLYTKEQQPLDGSIAVYQHGTSTLVTICDVEGSTLQNPQPVSDGLPDHQVFVADNIDVDIIVRDSDGVQVFSYCSLFAGLGSISTSSIYAVNTIADLRSATPSSAVSVTLLGYYNAGDKPSVVYRYTEDSTLVDDGGYIIASGVDDHYWVAKAGNTVDVRDYGYFPNGVQFTNGKSYRWYFPYVSDTEHTYHLGGVHLYNPVFDRNVIIIGDVSTANIDFPEGSPIYRGYVSIKANDLKSSMMGSEDVYLEPYNTLTLDTDAYAVVARNCDVLVRGNYANDLTLTNCRIRYLGGSITGKKRFTSCDVDGRCFVANDEDQMSGCTTDALTWEDGDDYVEFMLNNSNYALDLKGKTVTEIGNAGQNVTVTNAVFEDATVVQTNSTIVFNKCSGTIAELDEGEDDVHTAKAIFYDCDIAGTLVSQSRPLRCKCIEAVGTAFNAMVCCRSGSSFSDCSFTANPMITVESTTMEYRDISFVGCQFNGGSPIFSSMLDFSAELAIANTVYLDNILISGNITTDNVPAHVLDSTIFVATLGKYNVSNNGSGLLESRIPASGCISTEINAGYADWETIGTTNYVWALKQVLSIASLTFNFGESFNLNVQPDIKVKARIFWKTGGTDYATNVTEAVATNVTFVSGTGIYNINKPWTKARNNSLGLIATTAPTSASTNWVVKATWNTLSDDDFGTADND